MRFANKTTTGHCNVPQDTKKVKSADHDEDLAQWVKMQRMKKKYTDLRAKGIYVDPKNASISKERVDMLNSIGFQWILKEKPNLGWDKRFEQVLEYKSIHGHVNIPQSYVHVDPINPNVTNKLGRWVMKQRHEHSLKLRGMKTQLTDERQERLESIGFQWVATGYTKKSVPEFNATNKNDNANSNNGDDGGADKEDTNTTTTTRQQQLQQQLGDSAAANHNLHHPQQHLHPQAHYDTIDPHHHHHIDNAVVAGGGDGTGYYPMVLTNASATTQQGGLLPPHHDPHQQQHHQPNLHPPHHDGHHPHHHHPQGHEHHQGQQRWV